MVRHQDCCNTLTNQRTFSFPCPGTLTGILLTRSSVLRTNNDAAANPHNPVCLHNQTTHTAAMILSGGFRTFSPTSHKLVPGPK